MAAVPPYNPSFSFLSFEVSFPDDPKPGMQLDTEYSNVAVSVNSLIGNLSAIQRDDLALANQIVTLDSLTPGVFDFVVDDAIAAVTPYVDAAEAYALAAEASELDAGDSAQSADIDSQLAAGSAANAAVSAISADDSELNAENLANDAAFSAALSANSQNLSELQSIIATAAKVSATQWAEYLAGPVPVDEIPPPGLPPEAIESGYFSARWWANKAESFLAGVNWYLGPFDVPPTSDLAGAPLQDGHLYFNPTVGPSGTMFVYSNNTWINMTTAVSGWVDEYVYYMAGGSTTISGLDAGGREPEWSNALIGFEPLLNGVHTVEGIDWTLDRTLGQIVFAVPLAFDSVVMVKTTTNIVPKNQLTVKIDILQDISSGFDGSTTGFALLTTGGDPATATSVAEYFLELDGLLQRPGVDFTNSGNVVTFVTAPESEVLFYGRWMRSETSDTYNDLLARVIWLEGAV